MKLQTHFIIAKIAAEKAGLTAVKKTVFCIGSLIPDLSPMQFIHRHFYRQSGEYIMKKLERLSGKNSIFRFLSLEKQRTMSAISAALFISAEKSEMSAGIFYMNAGLTVMQLKNIPC